MLKSKSIHAIFLLFVFLAGCVVPPESKVNALVKDVDAFTLDAPGVMEIVQGDVESFEISGDPALIAYVKTEVVNRRLVISTTSEISSNAGITYKLFVKDLNDVVLNSFGAIKNSQLKTKRLRMTINGPGRIQMGEINADSLTVEINDGGSFSADVIRSASAEFSSSGAGNISIAGGSTDQLDLTMELGTFIGDNFKSQSAVVAVNGTGIVLVWVVQKLDVKVNGAGRVTYYGEPTMNMSMSGGGQITGGGRK